MRRLDGCAGVLACSLLSIAPSCTGLDGRAQGPADGIRAESPDAGANGSWNASSGGAAATGDGDANPGDGDLRGGKLDGSSTTASNAAAMAAPRAACPAGATPPASWQEHWFEHIQNVSLVDYDDCAAIYFDADMDPAQAAWLFPFVSQAWKYSLATYGQMGPERVFAIFHQGRYGGGHPSYYYDASHDSRNVIDNGQDSWSDGDWDIPSHELGHIVESTATHTKYGSPAFGIWGDSKWNEFYQYDLYLALGMERHAQLVFDRFTQQQDDFPRAGTHWFRDWFYPLWRDHGHALVMVRFFELLAQYYPARNGQMGAMTWGEYIHFTSGAAQTDLKVLATQAFGWPPEWDAELALARASFPQIRY